MIPGGVGDDGTVEEAPKEKTKEKFVLGNPVWEVEKVGFNEEADM